MSIGIQKYWKNKANYIIDWKHLGLTSKEEYETKD